MAITLEPLPFAEDALEPHISRETIEFHYHKHHAGYVDKLNDAIAGTDREDQSLEEIIASSEGDVFNNAAQVWNHTFYWHCMTPDSVGAPDDTLARAIDASFGSFDNLREKFLANAGSNFGSGWTWLVKDSGGKLDILNTADADTPLKHAGMTPLLTVDVWEHAYYIDYRNERGDYLDTFWKLINWKFVSSNFS